MSELSNNQEITKALISKVMKEMSNRGLKAQKVKHGKNYSKEMSRRSNLRGKKSGDN